jgi:hypothetical protein
MTNVDFWLAAIKRVPLRNGSVNFGISSGILNL